jgi:ATP-dependent exoDNAse (exonuclease V) beta subunit
MLKIHKASAGSGKTYSLTREYLKLLLGYKKGGRYRLRPLSAYGYQKPKAHGEILAVTFTNKATEEMTTRIINELAALADASGLCKSPYLEEFMNEFDTDAVTLRKHAGRALADVLYNFSWFSVSTIDSFFQRVLNTFTRELELPANHNVEMDDKYALAIAVGKMLASINYRPAVADADERRQQRYLEEWLRQYMMSMVAEGKSFNLLSQTSSVNAGLISDLGHFFTETYKLNRAVIDGYLSDPGRIVRFAQALAPGGVIAGEKERVCALCRRAVDMADESVLKNLVTRLTAYADGDFSTLPSDTFKRAAADSDACFKKKADPSPGLRRVMEEALQGALEYVGRSQLFSYLYSRVFQLGLFGQMHRYLDEYRRQTDSLLLSDTNDLLRRIINEDETPFIYERMGTTIRHYLIDEFQDTSQMQWENLKPLVLESLSRGNDNLIIGDEKQCIYRFRNSDPELLGNRVERLVRGRFPDAVSMHGNNVAENCNWRSSADVVRFNNTVFNAMAGLLDGNAAVKTIAGTYAGLVQQIPPKHAGFKGYVKILFAPDDAAATDDEEDGGTAGQLELMTDEISRQLAAGYRPRDIAVLVRKKSQGKAVITHLMDVMDNDPQWRHGTIPVVSADSMEISISPAVRMIVNVLRLTTQPMLVTQPGGEVDGEGRPVNVINPAYRRYRLLHRFELCRFDTVEAVDEQGNPVVDDEGRVVMRRLTDQEALAKAVAATSVPFDETPECIQGEIDAEIRRLSEMESPTLLAMTERIIGRFLTPDARRRENVFITAFQDLVLDFSERGEGNVNAFLQWWDRTGAFTNVAAPDGLDAINVLTIHKAKGLEYECVHLPYFSEPMVKYHTSYVKSISWYHIDPEALPGIDPECVPPLMPLPNRASNKNMPALKADAEKWETEQKTDALNVAYVAFTRAVSELCVYVDKTGGRRKEGSATKGEPVPSIGEYLKLAIKAVTPGYLASEAVPGGAREWMVPLSPCLRDVDGGGAEFIMGEPTVPRREPADEAGAPGGKSVDDGISLPATYEVNDRSEICATMDFEDTTDFDFANDRHRGTFLHGVLGRVNHLSDLDLALERQAYRYRLSEDDTAECRRLLAGALADPRVRPWFEGFRRAVNERPLTGPQSLRRPDRVVWLADGTIAVIDYKFGAHNLAAYREQVRDYVSLLADAGHKGAQGFLWFPLKGEIVRVV